MKKIIAALCAAALLCVSAAGCAGTDSSSQQSSETSTPSVTSQSESEVVNSQNAGEEDFDYEVREIWCDNNGEKIYGEAYIPKAEGKFPLVIHSHGLGANHNSDSAYAKDYASKGIAVYTFDFRGGSYNPENNRSDGKSTEMSVMTEASDLETVLDAAKTWDFADTDKIFLQGGSQGGLVSAIVGMRRQAEIKGLILLYPAFGLYDFVHSQYEYDEFPDEMKVGKMTVGKKYGQDLWDYDVRDDIPDFKKPVIILQGSEDDIVSPAFTYAASQLYPNSEYYVIDGAGHGFSGEQQKQASAYALDYLFRNI